jgi:ribonuclease-3
LVKVAESIGLGDFLVLSKSEQQTGGSSKPAILADACEAVIAALYLDGGLEAARRFVLEHWHEIAESLGDAEKDPKTALQEWIHKRSGNAPVYEVTKQEGPPHAPVFTVEVRIDDLPPVSGEAASKRRAEQVAAASMLEALKKRPKRR